LLPGEEVLAVCWTPLTLFCWGIGASLISAIQVEDQFLAQTANILSGEMRVHSLLLLGRKEEVEDQLPCLPSEFWEYGLCIGVWLRREGTAKMIFWG
jgi:hypothetical protein